MTELTPEAQNALKAYLERVRVSLRGTSMDADEVERDVREHIDEALNGRSEPVSAGNLSGVLERLLSGDTCPNPVHDMPSWASPCPQLLLVCCQTPEAVRRFAGNLQGLCF